MTCDNKIRHVKIFYFLSGIVERSRNSNSEICHNVFVFETVKRREIIMTLLWQKGYHDNEIIKFYISQISRMSQINISKFIVTFRISNMSLALRFVGKASSYISKYYSARCISSQSIGIIGVPFDKGAGKKGVNEGPKALRDAGLIDEIRSISQKLDVKDYGDVHYDVLSQNTSDETVGEFCKIKELNHVAACSEALAARIEQITNDGRMPIALGGDHSLAIGEYLFSYTENCELIDMKFSY